MSVIATDAVEFVIIALYSMERTIELEQSAYNLPRSRTAQMKVRRQIHIFNCSYEQSKKATSSRMMVSVDPWNNLSGKYFTSTQTEGQ